MSNNTTTTTDQGQNAATKEVEKSTAKTNIDNQGDSGASKEEELQQTGPGPKVLRSHFRGMPRQWEKNQPPKKDDEGEQNS
ncbi:hypothetical protein NPX13_g10574 [Xylaria arbuscula]|uniref:Uncharacterized protein n=1 Tax=Xylaria arbuscula TaxID=114810 RepID=A0A9W8N4R7_9PEZI|nr:hypothetical protein NPX13_g10574 [Xylaria arbuscula]